jgi:signal peptide peptidase SppA
MKQLTRLSQRILGVPLMMEPRKLDVILHVLSPRIGVEAPVVEAAMLAERNDRKPYAVTPNGTAIIDVSGSLVNRMDADALSGMTNYEELGHEVMDAATDGRIKAVVMRFDSYGGEVSGCFDLAKLIRDAAQLKPVYACVDDAAFSAAYLLASACSKVYLSETGGTGSIGVRAMHVDFSERNSAMGVKPTVIFAGAKKDDMSPNAPLSDSARTDLQGEVDRLYGMFVSAVAENRGMSEAAVRATEAGLFHGSDAIRAGLADQILPFRAAVAQIEKTAAGMNPISRMTAHAEPAEITEDKEKVMSEQTQTPTPIVAEGIDYLAIADLCAIAGKPVKCVEFVQRKLTVMEVREELLKMASDPNLSPEIMSSPTGLAQTITGTLESAAASLMAASPALSKYQAYAKAVKTNPALYDQYLAANPAQTGGR